MSTPELSLSKAQTVESKVKKILVDLKDNGTAKKSWFKKNSPNVVILAAAKVGGILSNLKNPSDFILQNLRIQIGRK